MNGAFRTALASGILSSLLGVVLTLAVFVLIRRNAGARERQQWLQSGQVGLAEAMLGDKSVADLADGILAFLARYLGFQAGALFKGEGLHYDLAAILGVPADADIPARFRLKQGFWDRWRPKAGRMVVRDVPDGYLTIGSAFGRDKPRHLVIVPARADGAVNAVIELGFLHPVDDRDPRAAGPDAPRRSASPCARRAIGPSCRRCWRRPSARPRSCRCRARSCASPTKSWRNRAGRSRNRRRGSNSSRWSWSRPTASSRNRPRRWKRSATTWSAPAPPMQLKARELEQASRYKSDFLANMSHELRTPLNSLLILSKLLGDNPDGNLTDEQVKYARTIQSSGNDLLTLINDILDLSKIEAGQIQIQPEPVPLQRLAGDICGGPSSRSRTQRGLSFEIAVAGGCPAAIDTDRQRLEQILKNLLSNAFKFTERGAVRLTIAPVGADRLAFAVTDTGIGISAEQQESIFEAFRQADGTISRKYGGTGLGLSISRELARLLGGVDQARESTRARAAPSPSTVPLLLRPAGRSPPRDARQPLRAGPPPAASAALPTPPPRSPSRGVIDDDRDLADDARRLLLVVEDDEPVRHHHPRPRPRNGLPAASWPARPRKPCGWPGDTSPAPWFSMSACPTSPASRSSID